MTDGDEITIDDCIRTAEAQHEKLRALAIERRESDAFLFMELVCAADTAELYADLLRAVRGHRGEVLHQESHGFSTSLNDQMLWDHLGLPDPLPLVFPADLDLLPAAERDEVAALCEWPPAELHPEDCPECSPLEIEPSAEPLVAINIHDLGELCAMARALCRHDGGWLPDAQGSRLLDRVEPIAAGRSIIGLVVPPEERFTEALADSLSDLDYLISTNKAFPSLGADANRAALADLLSILSDGQP